jgi:hypothetical protein
MVQGVARVSCSVLPNNLPFGPPQHRHRRTADRIKEMDSAYMALVDHGFIRPIQRGGTWQTWTKSMNYQSRTRNNAGEWSVTRKVIPPQISMSDKSLVPYRQRSASRVLLLPCRLKGGVWIRRFGLNRVGIWQGNCFMEIHCSAAISCRLRHRPVQKSSDHRAGSDGVLHANCPAKSCYFPATREAGLVQIANSLTEQRGHKTFQISGVWADYRPTGSCA